MSCRTDHFRLATELRDRLGCTGAVVDAKPDAVNFYRGLGFVELPMLIGALGDRPGPVPMFLPIQRIAKAAFAKFPHLRQEASRA